MAFDKTWKYLFLICMLVLASCNAQQGDTRKDSFAFTGKKGEVKLIVLDPGHFHASLLQKNSLPVLNDSVLVYAPDSTGLVSYLKAIDSYNKRSENPTSWRTSCYVGDDFLNRMTNDVKGNVVILAGNNGNKTEKILHSINSGFHVLSDKPMAINSEHFRILENAYVSSKEKDVLLYDMMTERYDLLNIIAKRLINDKMVFGTLQHGTYKDPSISMESVHHFYKEVSGAPLIRPAWYYDVEQQGEGIADVTTHLIDLTFWSCFPETAIDYRKDIELLSATHWTTSLSLSDFTRSTKLDTFPSYLQPYLDNDELHVYANGIISYKVKEAHARLKVLWNYKAPDGGGDTFSSMIRGTNATISMKQDSAHNYVKQLYIRKENNIESDTFTHHLNQCIKMIQEEYPFVTLRETDEGTFLVDIPQEMRDNHEAHFTYVAQQFFEFLKDNKMPEWEVYNTLAKYYITTKAVEIANAVVE